MHRTLLLLSVLPAVLSALPAQFGRPSDPPKLEHFYYEQWDFDARHSRTGQASYYVLLPRTHDHDINQDRRFPLVLWLPGFGGPDDFLRRGGARTLDQLRGRGEIPELGVVVFRAPGRRSRTTYMNGEAIGDIEDLIVKDLLPHIEHRFRLGGRRELRALMGCSAGGFGALKIAMRHPRTFAAVAAHSAAILPADPDELSGFAESAVMRYLRGGIAEQLGDPIDKDKWMMQMPMGLAMKKEPTDLHGLRIYFDAGTDDHYGFFEPNRKLAAVLKEHGHTFTFREVEDGGHAWSNPKMLDNLGHSFRFVGEALTKPAKATKQK